MRDPPVEQLSKASVHPPESQPCFLILRNRLAKQPSGYRFFPAEHWMFTRSLGYCRVLSLLQENVVYHACAKWMVSEPSLRLKVMHNMYPQVTCLQSVANSQGNFLALVAELHKDHKAFVQALLSSTLFLKRNDSRILRISKQFFLMRLKHQATTRKPPDKIALYLHGIDLNRCSQLTPGTPYLERSVKPMRLYLLAPLL